MKFLLKRTELFLLLLKLLLSKQTYTLIHITQTVHTELCN